MRSAVYESVDEKPRFHALDELRAGNVRPIQWKLWRHFHGLRDEKALQALLPAGSPTSDGLVRDLLAELETSQDLTAALKGRAAQEWARSTNQDPTGLLSRFLSSAGLGRAIFLYAWTRLARPHVVIETGCFTGWDSAVILSALDTNNVGHLYTIDLPAKEETYSQVGAGSGLPEGLTTGFLVPERLHSRWTLTLGDARRELPPLLKKVGNVDLFFHDSHHSYTHMMWEYTSVWPFLKEKGVLASDDIAWNTAFWDFAAGVGSRPIILRRNPHVGALLREGVGVAGSRGG